MRHTDIFQFTQKCVFWIHLAKTFGGKIKNWYLFLEYLNWTLYKYFTSLWKNDKKNVKDLIAFVSYPLNREKQ